MSSDSVRVVKVALVSHVAGALFKAITGILTGSAALVAEALHSLMDAINQGVLYRNAPKESQASGHIYSYGHGQVRYLVNLWATLGLFSIGAGLGFAWALYSLMDASQGEGLAAPLADSSGSWMSLLAVVGALVIQGYSFTLAARLYRARRLLGGQLQRPEVLAGFHRMLMEPSRQVTMLIELCAALRSL